MDLAKLEWYREVIESVLNEYAALPYSYAKIEAEVVFDRLRDRYLWMDVGWDGDLGVGHLSAPPARSVTTDRRIHGCLVHIDIIDGQIWIQRDGTEDGIAADLERAGIPKEHIVLGFRLPEIRHYSGYGVPYSS